MFQGVSHTAINTNGAVTLTAKVALESVGCSMHTSKACLTFIVCFVADVQLLTDFPSSDVCMFTELHLWCHNGINNLYSCFLPPKSYNSLVALMLNLPTFPLTHRHTVFFLLFFISFLPSGTKQISTSMQTKLIYVNNMDGDSLVIILPSFWGKLKVSLIPGSLVTDLIHNFSHLVCQYALVYLPLLI